MTTLRSDARRNREKILAAASELFAQRGAEVSVSDIARMAGVGHATVFRRFPTKESLVAGPARGAGRGPERRGGGGADTRGRLRGPAGRDGLHGREPGARPRPSRPWAPSIGSRFAARGARPRLAAFAALLRRAQGTGQVRDDLEPQDVMFLISAAGHAGPCRIDLPGLSGRYLGVILDGMRPEGATPLAPPAPSLAEIDAALKALAEPAAAASSS